MKILVCGGRDYNDADHLYTVLDELRADAIDKVDHITSVIHGDANGADALAGAWATLRGVQEVKCPANWNYHGRKAGFIRNSQMLNLNPDLVVAFPGGKGTSMLVDLAERSGIKVMRVE